MNDRGDFIFCCFSKLMIIAYLLIIGAKEIKVCFLTFNSKLRFFLCPSRVLCDGVGTRDALPTKKLFSLLHRENMTMSANPSPKSVVGAAPSCSTPVDMGSSSLYRTYPVESTLS